MPRGIPKSGERKNRADIRRRNRPAVVDPHQLYSVLEYAAASDQSPASAWNEIKAELVHVIRDPDSRRVRLTGAEIIRRNLERAGLQ